MLVKSKKIIMKMRSFFYLIILLMTGLFLVTCNESSDDNDPPTVTPTEGTPIFKAGDIVNCDFYVDDVLREQMIDTIVNLGTAERPALFYVNRDHTLDGEPIAIGNHYSNIFRSLTRGDIYKFIVLWGTVHGLNINLNDTSSIAVGLRQEAFYALQEFIVYHDLDFPLLVSLADNQEELKCAERWAIAATDLSNSGIELAEQNTPDHIFRSLEIKGFSLAEVSSVIQAQGMDEKEFLMMSQDKGIDLEQTLMQMDSPRQVNIVCLVAMGVKMFTSWLLKFINNGTANPNLVNEYASYLNNNDTLVMDYYTGQTMVSPTYSIAYCTLVKASFYIETKYDAYHATIPGQYINRVGMKVISIKCSWGMKLNGSTTFKAGDYSGPEDNPIAQCTGNVTIKYGDCCAVKRTGVLQFNVSGDIGYEQVSWDSNVK